jgi:hypothetical protein
MYPDKSKYSHAPASDDSVICGHSYTWFTAAQTKIGKLIKA